MLPEKENDIVAIRYAVRIKDVPQEAQRLLQDFATRLEELTNVATHRWAHGEINRDILKSIGQGGVELEDLHRRLADVTSMLIGYFDYGFPTSAENEEDDTTVDLGEESDSVVDEP